MKSEEVDMHIETLVDAIKEMEPLQQLYIATKIMNNTSFRLLGVESEKTEDAIEIDDEIKLKLDRISNPFILLLSKKTAVEQSEIGVKLLENTNNKHKDDLQEIADIIESKIKEIKKENSINDDVNKY